MHVIEEYRHRKNLTIRQLADKLDCSTGAISRVINGAPASNKFIVRTATALGLSIEDAAKFCRGERIPSLFEEKPAAAAGGGI